MTDSKSARTTVSLLTPEGRGAVAVLKVRGDDTRMCLEKCFVAKSEQVVDQLQLERPYYGEWTCNSGLAEDLIVILVAESELEIHCHGGDFAWKRIVVGLQKLGIEKTQLSDSPSRVSSIEEEALFELPKAKSTRTAGILLDQVNGAFRSEMKTVTDWIGQGQISNAIEKIERLLGRVPLGKHLTECWHVVLVGAPNVGKSSLINSLLGFERSIVFDRPGTTRDVLVDQTAIDGWPIELADTVGVRDSQSSVEASGIERTKSVLSDADLVIYVFDDDPTENDQRDVLELIGQSNTQCIWVRNKIDLVQNNNARVAGDLSKNIVSTSTVSEEGIDDLTAAISKSLVGIEPQIGDAIPFLTEHELLLNFMKTSLEENDLQTALVLAQQLVTGQRAENGPSGTR